MYDLSYHIRVSARACLVCDFVCAFIRVYYVGGGGAYFSTYTLC